MCLEYFPEGTNDLQGILLRYDGTSWSEVVLDEGSLAPGYGAFLSRDFNGDLLLTNTFTEHAECIPTCDSECREDPDDPWKYRTTRSWTSVMRYDGKDWIVEERYGGEYNDAWAAPTGETAAVGRRRDTGLVMTFDGSGWQEQEIEGVGELFGIWGMSFDDLFAVGQGGAIVRFDGNVWSEMESGTTNNIRGIWGSSSSDIDIFAVGDWGTILHYSKSVPSGGGSSTSCFLQTVNTR